MKKIFLISLISYSTSFFAQFTVKAEVPSNFSVQEAYLYSLNGSKDMLLSKSKKSNNYFQFKVDKPYIGMLKIYFPEFNTSISLITENKDASLKFQVKNNKVSRTDYIDATNILMEEVQGKQKKQEQILPALLQIKPYYKDNSDFGIAIEKEINYLQNEVIFDKQLHPLISYYNENYNKFLTESALKPAATNNDIISFITNSNEYLETSSLLRPLLMNFLSNSNKDNLAGNVEKLLNSVNLETPRGQTILSELIEIFDVYSIRDLKDKYLSEARKLKCSINERLQNTLKSNNLTEIGVKIPNNTFIRVSNTKAKTLHDVKADKKIIILWASTCSHCEKEITEMLTKYETLKSKNIEIIGFSLDTDFKAYSDKVKMLPWINDSEIKGWYSSYVDTYNVHATPTFFIVDAQNKIISKPDNFNEALEFLKLK